MQADQDWDPTEWQGRKRHQVESNDWISGVAMGGIALVLVFHMLIEIFKMLFSSF